MANPGWYPDPKNPAIEWYWDGNTYVESRPTSGGLAAASAGNDGSAVLSFTCKIEGQKTQVSIFGDRIESKQSTGVSAGKITAGIFTGGLSLAATGVGKGSYAAGSALGSDVIRLDAVTGVASRKDGRDWIVAVSTPSMVIPWAVSKGEAQQIVRVLNDLIAKAKQAPVQAPPQVLVNVASNSGPSDAATVQAAQLAALSSPDVMANLEKLADMRYKRLISDEEFAAMKAKLLGS